VARRRATQKTAAFPSRRATAGLRAWERTAKRPTIELVYGIETLFDCPGPTDTPVTVAAGWGVPEESEACVQSSTT